VIDDIFSTLPLSVPPETGGGILTLQAATSLNNDCIVEFGPIDDLESSTSACQYWASDPVLFMTAGDCDAGAGASPKAWLGGQSF